MRHVGYGAHRIRTPSGSKFYVVGPYPITEFGPTRSIFYKRIWTHREYEEYGPIFSMGVYILYDTSVHIFYPWVHG